MKYYCLQYFWDMPSTVASESPFSVFCSLLNSISGAKKADNRKNYLKRYLDYWRRRHESIHGSSKTHMLATKFISVFCLSKDSDDAQSLLKYRAPHGKAEDIGDFASKASRVLKLRLAQKCTMTIEQLNTRLDSIAVANAAKDKATVERELEMLCREVTEKEMKWLIRILLKQMKLGMQETTVLNVFHQEASQLYDVTTSLQKVCEVLRDPSSKLDVISIQLFNAFRPMLANRVAPHKVPEIMGSQPFYVETKYDGERVQLHKQGTKYKYYSRNGNDLTNSYGGSPGEGSLTPYIHNVFNVSVDSCILDGEMVGWNFEAACIATKGQQFDVKSLKDGDDLNPCFVVFDCLMLNGDVISQNPLRERVDSLKMVFSSPVQGRCILAHRIEISTKDEVVDSLNRAVELREEGIIVKNPDSIYRLNTRSNEGGWLKIKPDYVDAMCDDLDLLIVGGYFGEGRRSNLMSHFLLALAEQGAEPSKFVTVCKIGSGYSLKELYDLNVHFNQFARLVRFKDKTKVPEWLKTSSEKPEVYIDPKNSKILQIRAAEIVPSNAYAAGYTLRFPRVEKIREDKTWSDCMTAKDFEQLRKDCEGKLGQMLKLGEGGSPVAKKRRGGGGAKVDTKSKLGQNFRPANLRGVKRSGNVFSGKECCIMNGTEEMSKQDLEIKVVEGGGSVVQNFGPKTFCVVAGRVTRPVQNVIKLGSVNVVKAEWLVRSVSASKLFSWVPQDMFFATKEIEKGFADDFDQFGDSYTQPVSEDELKRIMSNVQLKQRLSRNSLAELEEEYFPRYKYRLFHNCTFYVDRYLIVDRPDAPIEGSPLELVESELKLYGGSVALRFSDCSHVVFHSRDLSRLRYFNKANESRDKKLHFVTEEWVKDSISCQKILEERKYRV